MSEAPGTYRVKTTAARPANARAIILRAIARAERVAADLRAGLEGRPVSWGSSEFKLYRPVAASMGMTLATATGIKKAGRKLRPKAAPVARAYFTAPLAKTVDLFVLELHTEPAQK